MRPGSTRAKALTETIWHGDFAPHCLRSQAVPRDGRDVYREQQPAGLEPPVEVVEHDARLDHAALALHVEVEHVVEIFRAIDDQRRVHRLARVRGAAAADSDVHPLLARQSERVLDLFERARHHHAEAVERAYGALPLSIMAGKPGENRDNRYGPFVGITAIWHERRAAGGPPMTLDQVKHVLRELGWHNDGRKNVDLFLHHGRSNWTTGETTIDAGLVRVDGSNGAMWIDPAEITSISKGLASRLIDSRN